MNETYLYPWSAREARKRGELALWRASHKANIACKHSIEAAIRRDFDGMYLKPDCAESVIAEYGFKRVNFVLANTLKEKDYDGRFSPANKEWAEHFFVPPDDGHNPSFCVESHSAVLDGFINEARQAYQALGLFDPEHCTGDRQEQGQTGAPIIGSMELR